MNVETYGNTCQAQLGLNGELALHIAVGFFEYKQQYYEAFQLVLIFSKPQTPSLPAVNGYMNLLLLQTPLGPF